MYIFFWFLLLLCGIAVLFAFPGALWLEIRRMYGGTRTVTCPDNRDQVMVYLNAKKAANALFGPRKIEIAGCSRWPEKGDCAQGCVPEAISKNPPAEFSINHPAVFLTALVSWGASGVLRYSPFAREWMAAAGFPPAEFWARIGVRYPVIVGFFGLLAMAYVFTFVMRHTNQTGLAQSMLTASLLWLGVVGITIPETFFFVPFRVFALDALAMLIALLVQGVLVGVVVLPHYRMELLKK